MTVGERHQIRRIDGKSVVFPYLKHNELVNYKTRGIDNKTFTQSKNGQPTIFNYDRVLSQDFVILCEGELDSLRRFKEDVNEVKNGTECGMGIKNYKDIKPGDKIEVYDRKEEAQTI
mgnify:CR=1 FL=1